jgi:hypothetical protein
MQDVLLNAFGGLISLNFCAACAANVNHFLQGERPMKTTQILTMGRQLVLRSLWWR